MTEAEHDTEPEVAARRLLLSRCHGVLSTISLEADGYPFGSLASYVPDPDGLPLLLISRLAQHTSNLQADPRVSLTVVDDIVGDPQQAARLTLLARAEAIESPGEALLAHVERFQPQARSYLQELDFELFCLRPERARYIGGFGRIYWLAVERLFRSNPFSADTAASVLAHMNADHVDALRGYCRLQGVDCGDDALPAMCGVDAEGCHLRLAGRIVRVPFPYPVEQPGALRKVLVELARGGRHG